MKKRDFNLYVSVLAFIAGALFVLSNDADITANVIGASGESATLTAFIGILVIIASSVFFVLTVNHGEHDIESLVHKNENLHDDLSRQQKAEAELKDKYNYHNYEEHKK